MSFPLNYCPFLMSNIVLKSSRHALFLWHFTWWRKCRKACQICSWKFCFLFKAVGIYALSNAHLVVKWFDVRARFFSGLFFPTLCPLVTIDMASYS
jgi:hypothetical protein